MKGLIIALAGSLAITCVIFCQAAFGQEDGPSVMLAPIVVSASRIPGTAEGSPASTMIITGEEIQARHPSSVVDLLRQVPGLHIDQMGGRGGISSIYLRGGDPNFTLVLVDGVRVNDPTNPRGGSFDLSFLDLDSVERIEIVRGPLSSVHGSEAMAGVINIVTRHGGAEPEYAVQTDAGSDGYYGGRAEARGPCFKDGGFALAAAYKDNGEPIKGDAFRGKTFNGKVSLFPSKATELQCNLFYADHHRESFPDDSGGPDYAVLRQVDERDTTQLATGLEMGLEPMSWLKLLVKGSWYHQEEDSTSAGVAPGARDPFGIPANTSDSTFDRTEMEVSGLISVSERLCASIGIGTQFEDGDNDMSLTMFGAPVPFRFELDRQLLSSFMELRYSTKAGWAVEGGLRVDDPEDFDTEVSSKIGSMYTFRSTGTTLKANWGEGFKLPSFYALGNPIVGNPDLVPETSEGFDFSVIQDVLNGRARISVTPFYSRFFDIIDLEEGPPPRLVNRSEVTAKGVEVELFLRAMESLSFDCQVTYTETDIKGTDEELRNRPEWRCGIAMQWKPKPDFVLHLSGLYVGEVLDSSIPTGDRDLDPYIRWDVGALWSIRKNWELALGIDNILDADYEEAVGFPDPGIQVRAGLRLRF